MSFAMSFAMSKRVKGFADWTPTADTRALLDEVQPRATRPAGSRIRVAPLAPHRSYAPSTLQLADGPTCR